MKSARVFASCEIKTFSSFEADVKCVSSGRFIFLGSFVKHGFPAEFGLEDTAGHITGLWPYVLQSARRLKQ